MLTSRPQSITIILALMAALFATACGGSGATVSDDLSGEGSDVSQADADLDDADDGRDSSAPDTSDRDTQPPPRDTDDDSDSSREDTSIPELPHSEDAPLIFSVEPNFGPAGGGTLVQILGDNLSPDTRVFLDDVEQPDTDLFDETELWFITEAGEHGPKTLRLMNDAGVARLQDAFTYMAEPELERIEPNEGDERGGYPVVLHGLALSGDARVFFGDREALITQQDDDSIEVIAPPGPPRRQVSIELLVDGSRVRVPDAFRYNTAMTLAGLGPSEVPADRGGRVDLIGRNLSADCDAILGSMRLPILDGRGGTLSIIAPPAQPDTTAALTLDCGSDGALRLDDALTWVAPPSSAEAIVRIWPSSGDSAGGEVITLHGRGFPTSEDAEVRIGGTSVNIIDRSEDRYVVTTPALSAGDWDVELTHGSTTLLRRNIYRSYHRPRFDRLLPDAGPAADDWLSQAHGSGLDHVRAWYVDGGELEHTTNSQHLHALTVPAGGPGESSLAALLDNGSWAATGLTVARRGLPSIDRFYPTAGPAAGGNRVTIYGSGFDNACTVLVNDEPVAATRLGDAKLELVMPAQVGTQVSISVADCAAAGTFDEPYRLYSGRRGSGGVGGGPLRGMLIVHVLEQGTLAPVQGATVQVGVRQPYAWIGTTDGLGRVVFDDDDLRGPVTVTAFAPGRSVESFVDVDASEVTLQIWPLPVPPCDPADPDCQQPPGPPAAYIRGNLTGLDKQRVLPPGYVLQARIETSREIRGWANPWPGERGIIYEDGGFTIQSRLGDVALIARCGYLSESTGEFTTTAVGIRRGIRMRPDNLDQEMDIECNIPLSESVTVKLDGAPPLTDNPDLPGAYPVVYEASVFFDLGTDGVWDTFPPIIGHDPLFGGGAFPPLVGPLADVTFSVEAGAYAATGIYPSTATFVRNAQSYDQVLRFPTLMPVPEFTIPSTDNPVLHSGHIEWTIDETMPQPHAFYITINAENAGFSRWAVFVPGSHRSFNLTEFLMDAGVQIPTLPARSLRVVIRAIRLNRLDWTEFSRSIISSNQWRASSISYEVLPIFEVSTSPVED